MPVTMKDIARVSGVSHSAVSQVFRNPEHPRFSEETRRKILETAAQMGYRPNVFSQVLRRRRSHLLGLVLPWDNPEMMDRVEARADELGYRVMIQFTSNPKENREAKALQALLDWHADGIIWMPYGKVGEYREIIGKIADSGSELVLLQRELPGVTAQAVVTDYNKALQEMAEYLYQRGYRRFCFADYETEDPEIRQSWMVQLRQAAQSRNISFSTASVAKGEDALREVVCRLAAEDEQTALIAGNDWIAIDAVAATRTAGIEIPRQLGVVGIGDLLIGGRFRVSSLISPPLTVIRQDCTAQAEQAVDLMVAILEGRRERAVTPVTIPAQLVIQASTI